MLILSPETDNCPSWVSGRERMTVENISWSLSTKECCRPRRGSNPRPPGLQSNAHPTEPPRPAVCVDYMHMCQFFIRSLENIIQLRIQVPFYVLFLTCYVDIDRLLYDWCNSSLRSRPTFGPDWAISAEEYLSHVYGRETLSSRKHAYIILTPLNPTFI